MYRVCSACCMLSAILSCEQLIAGQPLPSLFADNTFPRTCRSIDAYAQGVLSQLCLEAAFTASGARYTHLLDVGIHNSCQLPCKLGFHQAFEFAQMRVRAEGFYSTAVLADRLAGQCGSQKTCAAPTSALRSPPWALFAL